jgi:hypothetical protein
MRAIAGILYEAIFMVAFSKSKTLKLSLPSLSALPMLRSLQRILDILHNSTLYVDELFSLDFCMDMLRTERSNGDQVALTIDPDKKEKEAIAATEKKLKGFGDLYRQFAYVSQRIGPDNAYLLPYYALNGPTITITVPRNIAFSSGYDLVNLFEKCYTAFPFSPNQRLFKILFVLEKNPDVGMQKWGIADFAKLLNEELPDFLYASKCPPCIDWSTYRSEGGCYELQKSLSLELCDRVAKAFNLIRHFRPDYHEKREDITWRGTRPQFIFFRNGTTNFKPGFVPFLPIVVGESLRQQIFSADGLRCSISDFYPCPKKKDELSQCPVGLSKVLKGVWMHTRAENSKTWRKPECIP